MSEKRITPANGPTSAGVEEEKALDTALFYFHFSTSGGPIASLLRSSGTHLTAKELAKTIGVSDPRVVTREIERERQSGNSPICASTDSSAPGYFMPQNRKELETYIRSLKRRHKAISQTISGMELALDRLTGQKRILEIDETEAKKE